MDQEAFDKTRLVELLTQHRNPKISLCRLCLAEKCNMFDVHETYINDKLNSVSSILNSLQLKVEPNNIYPSVICQDCLHEVSNIHNFLIKCRTSMEKLDNICENIRNSIPFLNADREDCILIIIPEEDTKTNDGKICISKRDKIESKINVTDLRFACKICSEEFISTELLYSHMRVIHNIENYDGYCEPKFIPKKKHQKKKHTCCVYCGQKQSKGFHSTSNDLKCDLCEHFYPCKGLLDHHMDNIHFSDKLSKELTANNNCRVLEVTPEVNEEHLSCNVCKRTYYSIAGLRKHMSSHFNVFICDYCGVKYTLKDNLRRHILIKHMKCMKFFCKLCPKGFLFLQEYVNHQRVHTKERSFQCHVCGKNFVAKKTLVNHMRLHTGERPYVCTLCDDSFVSASRLSEHTQVKHIGKLKCPKCHKEFTRKESITKHIKFQRCSTNKD